MFLMNDLSLHGQFADTASFREAIKRLMEIRQTTLRYGRTLYCHKGIAYAQVTPTSTMPQAVQSLSIDERRALMQWFTQQGPFWDDLRNHQPDDWLEFNGNIVTDTAIGEAGWCCLNAIDRELVSIDPSDWLFSPLSVIWVSDSGHRNVDVANYWTPEGVEVALESAPIPIDTWEKLAQLSIVRCTQLTFATDAFAPLNGYPFSSAAANRVMFILTTLDNFKFCFDEDGKLTSEGHEIYRNFFTGKKGNGGRGALFSDSSDYEKKKFEKELTFVHPEDDNETLFCPWHGKVQTPQLRVHFSWPVRADSPLYVVYVGSKITKQ